MKNHYLSGFLKLNCSGQLMELFSQSANPYKEITESMCAYKNAREYINIKNSSEIFIMVGDGSLALTGSLFAFLTNGDALSIDPKLNLEKVCHWREREKVKRIHFCSTKFQEFAENFRNYIPMDIKKYPYNLICVHAHVNLEELHKFLPNWKYLFTNPCCNPHELKEKVNKDEFFGMAYRSSTSKKEKIWGTPTANDAKNTLSDSQMGRDTLTAHIVEAEDGGKGGQLNPDWVESLMGYPLGWTDVRKGEITNIDFFEAWLNGTWENGLPRITLGMKNRVRRLKCLGNAVVPEIPAFLIGLIMRVLWQ